MEAERGTSRPATSVLVVDDEPAFRDALELGLRREGFEVHTVGDGEQALATFDGINPDIVLLDVMLPRVSGIDICRQIRSRSTTPVIMVSAKSEEIDAVVALEVGADDYITKPYRLRELVARIRSVLRRSRPAEDSSSEADLRVGPISLNRERHEVRLDDELVELPLKEFQLLAELMNQAGYVVTREDLINRVWGYDYIGDTKTLDVHIKRLRSKLEADAAEPILITTIRGLGYKIATP
ncbi:MAG: response regulator transcription factor [Acidimicrobiales bacterium]